jgi:hypothetical protein
LIRTPGRWRVAGVIFGSSERETSSRVGRKNCPSRDDWLASLDPGIAPYVDVLDAAGIETYESCEGGAGHSYAEPAVRFFGARGEGFRALAVALQHNLPVRAVRRIWTVNEDGHPEGPHWELAFWRASGLLVPAACIRRSEDGSLPLSRDA